MVSLRDGDGKACSNSLLVLEQVHGLGVAVANLVWLARRLQSTIVNQMPLDLRHVRMPPKTIKSLTSPCSICRLPLPCTIRKLASLEQFNAEVQSACSMRLMWYLNNEFLCAHQVRKSLLVNRDGQMNQPLPKAT